MDRQCVPRLRVNATIWPVARRGGTFAAKKQALGVFCVQRCFYSGLGASFVKYSL
jgi:hypothetical protein